MKLPAHGAMTVQNISQRPVNFVLNASAETATRLFHSYTSLSDNTRLSEQIFDVFFAKKDDSENFRLQPLINLLEDPVNFSDKGLFSTRFKLQAMRSNNGIKIKSQ